MSKKIGLLFAILINVNIIIGAGVFLNIKPLSFISGSVSSLVYILSGLILFPLVFSLAKLGQLYPTSGGLYVYSKNHLGKFFGFISGWSYFVGKTVSAAFLVYAFSNFFHQRLYFLRSVPIIFICSIVILFIAIINIIGAQVGGKIQFFFIFTKLVPIFFVIFFGITIITPGNYYSLHKPMVSLFGAIPIAIYALLGFEITCSIGSMIKNPRKNIFYAIIFSFIIVFVIYTLFQSIIFGALGKNIFNKSEPVAMLADKIFKNYFFGRFVTSLIFTSVIAGAFTIFTSNCWNLYKLSEDGHFPFKQFLTKTNKNNIPVVSLILESFIAILLLFISNNQVALQSMSVFGVAIAFLLSAISAFRASINKFISIMAILGSVYILFLCFQKIFYFGVSFPYIAIILFGIIISLFRKFFFRCRNV